MKSYIVYIVSNQYRTALYTGITNNMQRRIAQHYFDSMNARKSFAGKYNCYYLVYYEQFTEPLAALKREKEIKKWKRSKKHELIIAFNPKWESLNQQIFRIAT
ncbi:MAG: GIY-YIG nuclease family protein [Bacteroidia bacterium]|nr:GIY-YIG nuclease family protein [Bacteroidia bacterium]MBT8276161.1 GIY-YIG nuclease family protein [Bacteroidia bacterium]NNF30477.1 GIY-YIG nuclease family protein [Flavobacteriaceae bacterium]NNJ81970.1 GIY-YIG nuclease family protein [Flavobacteriaceae bacterium]NNK52936.1 GIY-YIG nuclease family protein [Flavobacteriaceae bacterium]